jgi:hypothetical protein
MPQRTERHRIHQQEFRLEAKTKPVLMILGHGQTPLDGRDRAVSQKAKKLLVAYEDRRGGGCGRRE